MKTPSSPDRANTRAPCTSCAALSSHGSHRKKASMSAFKRGHHFRRLQKLHFHFVHRQIVFLHVAKEVEVPAGGAWIGNGPADQVFRLLDVVASSKADLLPTRGRVGGYVELAAFVPAREPAEFGGGADIR